MNEGCPQIVNCIQGKAIEAQGEEIKHIHDTVFGNGKEGMDKTLVRIETNQVMITKRLDDLMLWIRGVGVAVIAGIIIALVKLV